MPIAPAWDAALAAAIASYYRPSWWCRRGSIRILGPAVLDGSRIINTHPALLPSFPGARRRDAPRTGAGDGTTCHWVDAGVDTGPIIDQRAVRVEPGDTEESLHERIQVEGARATRRCGAALAVPDQARLCTG